MISQKVGQSDIVADDEVEGSLRRVETKLAGRRQWDMFDTET